MADYALIAASILFAAFYCGAETGIYCVNRLRLRLRAERGEAAARRLLRLVARPRLAITTMLVGTNVGLYVATILCAQVLRRTSSAPHAELYSTLLMPPILLVLAELIPKSLFQDHADLLMYRLVWPLAVSRVLFYPLSALLRGISVGLNYLLGAGTPQRPVLFTPETFRFYLVESAQQGILSGFQQTMIENILRLKSQPVTAVMTPLADVVMVAEDAPLQTVHDVFRAHPFSRIPVYSGSRDRIMGIANVVDVASMETPLLIAADFDRGVLTVRKGTSVADALWALRQARQQLAAVIDDTGRAVGIVTVKDLVEEIVGGLKAW